MSSPHHKATQGDKTYWLRRWRLDLEIESSRLERHLEALKKKEILVQRLKDKIAMLEKEPDPAMTPAERAAQVEAMIAAAQIK